MYDTILFDMDGTIVDTGVGIRLSVYDALLKMGIDVGDPDTLDYFIGPPLRTSFRTRFQLSEKETETVVQHFRKRYAERGIYEHEIYAGMAQLLHRLQKSGKRLAVATSKPTAFAREILHQYGVDTCFTEIVGSEFDGSRSEKIDVLREVLHRLDLTEEERRRTAMVGDRKYDILGAKQFGLGSIGVEFGYAVPGELQEAGADYCVADSVELMALLLPEDEVQKKPV
ncbi:MAG: HAD hydrolase-like protein [Oscillospiraceae bacterium]